MNLPPSFSWKSTFSLCPCYRQHQNTFWLVAFTHTHIHPELQSSSSCCPRTVLQLQESLCPPWGKDQLRLTQLLPREANQKSEWFPYRATARPLRRTCGRDKGGTGGRNALFAARNQCLTSRAWGKGSRCPWALLEQGKRR